MVLPEVSLEVREFRDSKLILSGFLRRHSTCVQLLSHMARVYDACFFSETTVSLLAEIKCLAGVA